MSSEAWVKEVLQAATHVVCCVGPITQHLATAAPAALPGLGSLSCATQHMRMAYGTLGCAKRMLLAL
jgi:hypothetical protein